MSETFTLFFAVFAASRNYGKELIFHEKSKKDDEHQKWIHPDIIGAKFVEQTNTISNSLFKAISKKDSLRLYSYELNARLIMIMN